VQQEVRWAPTSTPRGPFWRKKDEGAWSIPKGEHDETENPLAAAKREFEEETGIRAVAAEFGRDWRDRDRPVGMKKLRLGVKRP
jgi:predicted NUDIX family NTP pyrophosphohydrolase